jgi:hypothetical protein
MCPGCLLVATMFAFLWRPLRARREQRRTEAAAGWRLDCAPATPVHPPTGSPRHARATTQT